MPRTTESLRVSRPAEIYSHLDIPGTHDAEVALQGLASMFEVTPRSEHPPGYDHRAWTEISDSMIEHHSGIVIPGVRPVEQNAKRVLGYMQLFPWLRKVADESSPLGLITEKEFFGMIGGFTVQHFPGLFGVTSGEARALDAKTHELGSERGNLAIEAGLYVQGAV